jgi:hypothetical protein
MILIIDINVMSHLFALLKYALIVLVSPGFISTADNKDKG